MNRHPDIRQRTAESAKWTRWRRIRLQRSFSRSMGSAASEAIVSGYFEQISTGAANGDGVGKKFASL
ncbi:MAG: hypothetical protein ACLPND_00565 [Candidatus Korobacteraceae bacterium]